MVKSTFPLRVLNIILRKCNKINAHNSGYSAAQEVEQTNVRVSVVNTTILSMLCVKKGAMWVGEKSKASRASNLEVKKDY